MNEDGWMMCLVCVGVCGVCVCDGQDNVLWWSFCDLSPSKVVSFLTWRIWHVDFGHRNLDNFSQLEIGHCWDWCWSLILWVWLSVIECDWVCKLTFCNRCASRNASAKMCLSLCVCVFVCVKMINVSKWSKFMLPTIVIFATTFPIPIWFRNWKWSFNTCHHVCNAGLFSVMIVIWYSIYKCLEMNKMFPKCPFRHTFWFL
jgi:hypothetical protein